MAAGATYEPIASTTLGSAQTNITFSSIPATYTDLRLVVTYLKATSGSAFPVAQFNSDTATNYSFTRLKGNGTTASSDTSTAMSYVVIDNGVGASTTIPGFGTMDIFSYAGSTYKTVLCTYSQDKNGSGEIGNLVNVWRSTSAINAVKVYEVGGGSFAVGTIATLYGIKAA